MKKLFSFLMLATIIATGCDKEKEYSDTLGTGEQTVTPSFVFEEGTYLTPNIGSDGGALRYNFTTNSTWAVTTSGTWVTIEPASGDATATSFSMIVAKNDTGRERTAVVRVEYGKNLSLNITVYQSAELCATNEVAYKSTNGEVITPTTVEGFGATFIDNTYADGYGKLRFEGDVKSIPAEAFKGCITLQSIILPDNLEVIDSYAFEGCRALDGVTIGDSVTTIGSGAFSGCRALKTAELGEGVTTIGDKAFYECSQLASISIPESVNAIGEYTFYNNISLVNVTLGNNLNSIEDHAFAFCTSLSEITIPDSVKDIETYAFADCTSLSKLYLGNSVETIGDHAFTYCTALSNIQVSKSLKSVGNFSFYRCEELTSINLGESLISVGESSFSNCVNLTSITLPATITAIGDRVLFGCDKLQSINCSAVTPPTLGNNAFDTYKIVNIGDNQDRYDIAAIGASINVPAESVDTYKSAVGWSNYASKIVGKDF